MSIQENIDAFLAIQSDAKRSELETLHTRIRQIAPEAEVWYLDGKDETGKVVTNPSIGYGSYMIRYADGKTKACHRIGLSANKTGISVYIMGLTDKNFLVNTFAPTIGKASVTGYCIRFKSIKEIDLATLEAAVRHGLAQS